MNYLEFIRSLGFGGLSGAGILALIFSTNPDCFSRGIGFKQMLIIDGLIGAGSHGLIEKWFIKSILGPLGNQLKFFRKLTYTLALKKMRVILEERVNKLIENPIKKQLVEKVKELPDSSE